MRWSWLQLFTVLSLVSLSAVQAAEKSPIGQKVDLFKLRDFRGAEHDSASWNQNDLTVVAFLGTECPLAKLYGPRLVELAAKYESKKVGFVAIDANQQDTLAEMAQYARTSKMEFPFLKDPANAVADSFGAVRTPEVFVLDRQQTIRYHGRIDDQYGIGFTRNEPKRQDLAIAIDELLAGKEISSAETPAAGCHIGRVHRGKPKGDITYSKDIAVIMQNHCANCHRSGEIGPFSLTSYEDVVSWSSTIREVIQEQRMPPWHASSEAGHFVNDRRLSDGEKKSLFDWIDNGMPAGNLKETPPPRQFTEGWQIPTPDLVMTMDEPYKVPAKGTVEYQYFPMNVTFDEDKWISAAEARPGNRAVVHHLILFWVPPGFERRVAEASLKNSIASFAPGMPAWQASPGMARRIPKGAKLYIQAHYTPNGSETTDQSKVGIVFADPKLVHQQLLTDAVVNFRLKIPPHADNAMFKADYGFRRDMRLVSLLPHMHLRGKAFKIESIDPDGSTRLLLNVPRYDFNWQNTYTFAEPLKMREGSKLLCTAWYDNSEKNPANPDPGQTVGWGDQTWEEMLVAQIELVLDDQDLQRGLPTVKPLDGDTYEVTFKYRPTTKVESVYLTGSFNKWKLDELAMSGPDQDGNYTTQQKLNAGTYEYKFVVDGKLLRNDPGNPDVAGQKENSVLRISAKAPARQDSPGASAP